MRAQRESAAYMCSACSTLCSRRGELEPEALQSLHKIKLYPGAFEANRGHHMYDVILLSAATVDYQSRSTFSSDE